MTSRSQILKNILTNQPAFRPVGEPPPLEHTSTKTVVEEFCASLSAIAVGVSLLDHIQPLLDDIALRNANGENIVTNLQLPASGDASAIEHTANDISFVKTVYLRAHLAVAENGAVWIDDRMITHRITPFFCDNLKLVINASEIVQTLHEAYRKINLESFGYGTFIAGPSKTADIEQSLVIGAHGAKSCEVFIITNI